MKYMFTIINLFIIGVIAYFCVDMMYKNIIPDTPLKKYFSKVLSEKVNQHPIEYGMNKNQYNIIVKRNLFQVETTSTNQTSEKQDTENDDLSELAPTKLDLALLGTVTGDYAEYVHAVIKNKKTNEQAIYQIGDLILNAKVKKILRRKVILTFQGKDQVLEMGEDNKTATKFAGEPDISEPYSNNNVLYISPNTIGDLVNYINIKDHIKNRKPDGMKINWIKKNSVFENVGLKQDDIIKSINGIPIASSKDALRLSGTMKDLQHATVTILRNGETKKLTFRVKNDP